MTRRAVAMIMVLAAVIVLLPAAAMIARTRATAALASSTQEQLLTAWSLCDAAEAAITAWLEDESRWVILSPQARTPMLSVLDDSITIGGRHARILVTAWDQGGMVPNTDLTAWPSLRRLVTDEERTCAAWIGEAHPGLDLTLGDIPIYPAPTILNALGARIATHNPAPGHSRRRGGNIPFINLNTAPEPLLRAVYHDMSLQGVDVVLQQRRDGKPAGTSTQPVNGEHSFRLAGSSTAWGFRTDVTLDRLRVSVWSVFTLRGGTWVREQRLVIAE